MVASPFVSTWKDFGDMMLWPQRVLELQEAIMAHTDEATTEELTGTAQPVPVIVAGS